MYCETCIQEFSKLLQRGMALTKWIDSYRCKHRWPSLMRGIGLASHSIMTTIDISQLGSSLEPSAAGSLSIS